MMGPLEEVTFPEFGDFIISFQMPYRLQRDIVERVWVGRA
jgi:hypothetical protein